MMTCTIESKITTLSQMPITLDVERVDLWMKDENLSESYVIDANMDDRHVESILEDSEGRFEMDGNLVRRRIPECSAKAKVPMFLASIWGQFFRGNYV